MTRDLDSMADELMAKHPPKPGEINLSRAETIDAICNQPIHHFQSSGAGMNGRWRWQVLFQGQWRDLGRTDLKDDIRTLGDIASPNDLVWKWPSGPIGARVSLDGFWIIDSLTDG